MSTCCTEAREDRGDRPPGPGEAPIQGAAEETRGAGEGHRVRAVRRADDHNVPALVQACDWYEVRDAAYPIGTGWRTRRVRLVRGEGRGVST